MHGRPRKPLNPEGIEDKDSIQKSNELRDLQSQLLRNHHNKIYTTEALKLSSKLLAINPEFNTAWNYRKLFVQHNLNSSQANQDLIKSILDQELEIVEIALTRNGKSYGAWYHRKWILNKGLSSLDHEFRLLDKFLKADPRNFHAWNYRRFVAALKNVPEEDELKYTTEMIDLNFSNYSAWHNRCAILSYLLVQKAQGFDSKEKVLGEEYEFVHNAIFTDPDDQSGWFYYFWLLDQTITPDAPVLVSSWPVHSSDLILSLDGRLDGCILSPCTTYCTNKGYFPFILYFSENVEGVNSSSVNIKYMFMKNEDISWEPLSTTNARYAKAWVAYLKFPDERNHSLKAYPVEVTVGHSQGIMSYSRSNYKFPSQFSFTVRIDEGDCKEVGREEFVWLDDRFSDEATLEDLNPMLSFDRLLIGQANNTETSDWQMETIVSQIDLFRKLNDKIGKLALARLLIAHDAMMSYDSSSTHKKVNTEEVLKLFTDLMKLDPSRSRYYKDQHSLIAIEQALLKLFSQREYSDMKVCLYYRDSNARYEDSLCVGLNNYSLSRIGSFEYLLWVRVLDLKYNELQSIEGLEALQLLSCLNLSHNKFRSLTALEPLRLYLYSSRLSDTIVTICENDVIEETDCPETVLFFKGLQLIQLDIEGNAFSNEKFRGLLVKSLPKLKLLDGEDVN
ncbi:hypothetical protein MKW94_029190 [Papaver nudicaule]|uniref:Geranylgeranyl transferase type-2 subunit alpha n=1 Tax=Papaver nudicaule TaxID=74823 RepID=A0AA41VPN9_PAPNU|nr:hypothetical protein [Papaver nudicaule]